MGKKVEMVGKKYNRLTIISETTKRSKKGSIYYLCHCDCGNTKIVDGRSIRKGLIKSCGCYHKEIISKKEEDKIHGTRLYRIYRNIMQRCYNTNARHYNIYGGRGIVMCKEWLGKNGFYNFKNWAMHNGYEEHLTIDRINNNGNYEPSNCRWATIQEQQNNKSTNRLFTYHNETHTIKEWSKIKNINYNTLLQRINNNKEPFAPIDVTKRHNCKKIKN